MGEKTVQLRVQNLCKKFDSDLLKAKLEVLKGVNLEIQRGEIFGFLGPNGAGKTTTIKTITGLIMPDEGEISICGYPHDSKAAKEKIGFMPERPGFYNHLSAKELLKFYADLFGISNSEALKRIDYLLELVGLESKANTKVGTYSKGMVQRLALAQALINEPELIILDEPLSGLDPIGRSDFRKIILELKKKGVTIFFSSHIIPDVENICDRVAILINGIVRAEGTVDEIVSLEVDEFEVTFDGLDLSSIRTPSVASNAGSDSCWLRVSAVNKDMLIKEITGSGGNLIRLNPVRMSLEEVLIGKYTEART